jgi:hypothetical protein
VWTKPPATSGDLHWPTKRVTNHKTPDALALLAWLFEDQLRKKIEGLLQDKDMPLDSLTVEERTDQIRTIDARLELSSTSKRPRCVHALRLTSTCCAGATRSRRLFKESAALQMRRGRSRRKRQSGKSFRLRTVQRSIELEPRGASYPAKRDEVLTLVTRPCRGAITGQITSRRISKRGISAPFRQLLKHLLLQFVHE